MADSFERFTERARLALQYAQEEATRMEHNYIGTEHLLLGLIRVEDGVSGHVLRQLGFELEKVRKSVEFIIGRGHTRFAPSLGLTPRAKKVLELAVVEAQQLRHPHIGTEHLLLGIIREGQGVAVGVIESFGVSLDSIRSALGEILGPPSTAESFESSLQPVVARDREIERLLNVLLRRTRHHPIVVGGVGAGRNSVVRGLVQRMATVELPIRLQFRRVLRMQAAEDLEKIDATFREARLGNNAVVASALERFSAEAVALLTSQLANGGFRIIGITTPLGFEAIAAEHPTFEEHVQPVLVEELPEAEAVSVLRLMVAPLEEHHSVTFGEDALITAVELARRYQPDRLLPGSAVELLDDAARLASRMVSADNVWAALQQGDTPVRTLEDADAHATVERLRTTFSLTIADKLVEMLGNRSALLAYVSRGAHTRQFARSLAAALFGTSSALVELDLASAPWHLATYPPGRVWFPEDQHPADVLRRSPRCLLVLSSADRSSAAGLDLATHVLRTRHLTDPHGRRLDLSQAAIIVTAAHGALVDPMLLELLPTRLELTRAWAG